jgi:fructose-1,6-bisphosphatase/inositol monophosphatase family enzyme
MQKFSPDDVTALIREAVEAELLPRFGRLQQHEIREKGPGDLVTVADEAMERHLRASLTELLPGSITVGEEEVAANPSVLDRLQDDSPVWVLDPIDGTTNFSRADRRIAVIVALVRKGETIAGWIHDPLENITATTEKGGGSWIGSQRQTIYPRHPDRELTELRGWLSAGGPDRARSERVRNLRAGFTAIENLKCIGQMFLTLLGGRTEMGFYHRSKPWDFAAGALMTEEAGGMVRRLDGSAYAPVANAGPLLIAQDDVTWRELKSLIDPGS